jgi:DnaJ-class molecular chaperone
MSIPPIRIERCDACKGTGAVKRQFASTHPKTRPDYKNVKIACHRCGGRGFHRRSK